jgi:NAD-dependent SIR2 family protein deacetylase
LKSKELEDLYSVLTAGARLSGEKSTAQPQRFYRDPAESVKFPAEVVRQEEARKEKAVKLKKQKQKQKQSKHRYTRKLRGG